MKQRLHPLTQALALILPIGGLQFSPSVALADLQSTTSVVFSGNTSNSVITGGKFGGRTVNDDGSTIKTVDLPTFSPTTGVLTGAQLSIKTPQPSKIGTARSFFQQTVDVNNLGNPGGGKFAGSSNGEVSVGFSGPGASASSAQFSLTSTCLNTFQSGCTSTNKATQGFSLSSTVGGGDLENYVGEKGTVLVKLTTPTFRLDAGNGIANVRGSQTVTWKGNLAATYSFLEHAAPSFSLSTPQTALTLDFGTLQLGASKTLNWSISSPGNSNTVGLDFDSFSSSSADSAKFNIGANLFTNLAAGTKKDFTAAFDTSKSGSFIANYLLQFSDANVGASSTRFNYDLNLTLKGAVSQPVPLPAAWTLMVGPVLGCLFGRKSRKRRESS
ncbi:MAG: hypothetical protein ABL925_11245 [Methylococcales bacterium]